MIRTLGFLTGIAVTGTAVWLLSDARAFEAAIDSMASYLEGTASSRPMAPQDQQTQTGILPPAAIMSRPAVPRATPAGTVSAAAAEPVAALTAPIEMQGPPGEPTAAIEEAPAAEPEVRPNEYPAMADAAVVPPDAVTTPRSETTSGTAGSDESGSAESPPTSPGTRPSMQDPIDPQADVEQAGDPALYADGNWFAFWTPFRSRASADGFARHLVQATGQEIRVLRVGPGEYRVAFFHDGEEDRQRHLASLESASGLELGGEL